MIMLTDHTIAVAKAIETPLNKTLLVTLLDPVLSWLTSHVPTIMTTVPSKRKDVTRSPRNKTAKNVVNNGYAQETGTALETPIKAKLIMYIVSPKNRPTIPLRLARSKESIPKVAKFHSLPDTAKHAKRKIVVDMHREMLAGIGFASDKATLYKTGDRVQQKAAAKAASSPITSITPRL